MKTIEAIAVHSMSRPGGVSIRAADGKTSIRRALEAAGIAPGERLVIIPVENLRARVAELEANKREARGVLEHIARTGQPSGGRILRNSRLEEACGHRANELKCLLSEEADHE